MATDISSTEFQNSAGHYLDEAGKRPVFITKYGRPTRVLMDIEEYERLIAHERKHYYTKDLPEDLVAELEKGYQGEPTPDLEHLMD
jgi:prevent-host-death family protein